MAAKAMTVSYDGSGNLVVVGTAGNDNIYVNTNDPTDILVQINGVTQPGPWTVNPITNRIIIRGVGGSNLIQLSGAVNGEITTDAPGNNRVLCGDGNDVVICTGGNDVINGGGGNNVLVGGGGIDFLYGGSGNSILIAGTLIPGTCNGGDWSYDQLRQLGDAWAASSGGQTGADAASTAVLGDTSLRTSPANYVSDPTNAANKDYLYCGAGNDWIIVATNDFLSGFGASGNDYKSVV